MSPDFTTEIPSQTPLVFACFRPRYRWPTSRPRFAPNIVNKVSRIYYPPDSKHGTAVALNYHGGRKYLPIVTLKRAGEPKQSHFQRGSRYPCALVASGASTHCQIVKERLQFAAGSSAKSSRYHSILVLTITHVRGSAIHRFCCQNPIDHDTRQMHDIHVADLQGSQLKRLVGPSVSSSASSSHYRFILVIAIVIVWGLLLRHVGCQDFLAGVCPVFVSIGTA